MAGGRVSVFLYLIAAKGTAFPVKIGIASDPQKRIRQLQTGNPFPLEIIAQVEAPDRPTAMGWEDLAHRLFSDKRLNGEWFDVPAVTVMEHIHHWKTDKPARSKKNPKPRSKQGNHPEVPDALCKKRMRDMTMEERLEFWACFDLPAPPYGFDDWYIVGTQKWGVVAAFPVVGFVHGEPD